MVDIKIVDILKAMKEEETDKIGTENTNTTYTHGDKAEALNNAIFMYEHKDDYISKDILRQKKKDIEHKVEVHKQGTWTLSENQKYELGAELSFINELLEEV